MKAKALTVSQKVKAGDPGRLATPEEAQQAKAEARTLLQEIAPLNLPRAAEHIRSNPPSAEAVAILGFIVHDVLKRREASQRAKMPRKGSLQWKIRNAGVTRYVEMASKSPELLDAMAKKYPKSFKRRLTDAISKANRESPKLAMATLDDRFR